jgi:hypothetical protein
MKLLFVLLLNQPLSCLNGKDNLNVNPGISVSHPGTKYGMSKKPGNAKIDQSALLHPTQGDRVRHGAAGFENPETDPAAVNPARGDLWIARGHPSTLVFCGGAAVNLGIFHRTHRAAAKQNRIVRPLFL